MIIRFIRSAKGNSCITGRPHKLSIRGHSFDVFNRFGQGNGNDIAGLQCNHHAMFSVGQRPDRTRAKVCGQHTIESIGPAAALQVAQNYATRFSSSDVFEIALQVVTDAAESRRMQCITFVLVDQVVTDLDSSFSDDNNTKV